mgnify:CR=1
MLFSSPIPYPNNDFVDCLWAYARNIINGLDASVGAGGDDPGGGDRTNAAHLLHLISGFTVRPLDEIGFPF